MSFKSLDMKSHGLCGWALNPTTNVLIRHTQRRDRGGREGHVKMEAEARAMQPQVKEALGLPEAGRGQEGFSSRAFGESMILLTP